MNILSDLSFARRTLAKHPLVTIAAVVTLALGIGANTTVFSVVRAIFVDSFVFHDQKNTVILFSENTAHRNTKEGVSIPDFRDWREHGRSFDEMAIAVPGVVALSGLKEPMRLKAARVSDAFFSFFDFKPSLGRSFTADEFRAGAPHSVVVSHSFWETQLGRDPGAIGKVVHLNGDAFTIVGVMPPSFWMPSRTNSIWLPLTPPVSSPEIRSVREGIVLAHLRPGVTLEQANQELSAISRQLAALYPLANSGWGGRAWEPLRGVMGDKDPILLGVLFGVVGALLLVACSNVANLLLAQAAIRRREMSIRTAVGASRWHLIRQSLTESLLLSAMAGVVGLLAGFWAKDCFIAIYPSPILIANRVMDPAVLGFCLLISVLAALVFGLAPAWDSSRADPIEGLKESRHSGARTHRLANVFVSSQIALSMILLIVTGLLLEDVRHLRRLDLGFRPDGLIVVNLDPSTVRHAGSEQLRTFYRSAMDRVASVAQVRAVSATSHLPVFTEGTPVHVAMPGETAAPAERPVAMQVVIAPHYFEVAGTPLRRGREFRNQDTASTARVAVINQAFADRFWNYTDPIGRQIRLTDADARGDLWTIVGVAANVKPPSLQGPAHPQIYVPFDQAPQRAMSLLVTTSSDPARILTGLRKAIAGVDGDEPVEATTMRQMLRDQIRQLAIIFDMLGVFAGLALTMASVGLFALIAYSVNERTREIGIRMALGATESGVIGLVIRRGMRLALIGMAVGLAAGAAITQLLGSLLIEFSPWDPTTFIGVSAILIIVAALASYLPARRATRIDPITALRQE
ncbi:MAG TPA: ABC transporter permease [Bryobacteraceae bacterium]|nr:ABC transporter permease [Bryobacteraceae bacterium]